MTAPVPATSVQSLAAATISKAQRAGLFWQLRPATVVEASAGGQPRVRLDGDTEPIRVASLVGALPEDSRVMVVETPPSGNHVVGYLGPADVGTRLIGYHQRVTNRTGITAEVAHIRISGMTRTTNHLYRVRLTGIGFSNVTTRVFLRLRHDLTGAAATTASASIAVAVHQTTAVGSTGGTREATGYLLSTDDGPWSVLASLTADAAIATVSANVDQPNVLAIEDLGLVGSTVASGENL